MITRLCLDHLNARSKAWQQDNEEDFISNIENNEKSALESLHQSQTYSIVQKAILSLKPRQRAALVAWAYQDASINEIANMLEINANAATQLLHRAKLNLETSLRGLGYEE
jgi:RNA polymerase sigma-70 factor (ECF subfamily)